MSAPAAQRQSHSLTSDLVLLRPALRAYLFALVSVTLPRTASLLIAAFRGKLNAHDALQRILAAVRHQLAVDRFPFTCGLLLLGAFAVPRLIIRLIASFSSSVPSRWSARRSTALTFFTTFVAALASFSFLNRTPSRPERFVTASSRPLGTGSGDNDARTAADKHVLVETADRRKVEAQGVPVLAGKTLDLTFFGLVRALDIAASLGWSRYAPRLPKRVRVVVEEGAVPTLFATSSALVMWTWFYVPHFLPPSYRAWISSASEIDDRLIRALREIKFGTFIYGQDTGRAELLGGMCRDMGMPEVWGDPAKTVPIPCEMYHCGSGKNCEYHCASRFFRAWKFAMRMYLPLNLALLLRRKVTMQSLRHALLEASRSSAFLGAFVALFYYGVCLGRTRIGPLLTSEKGTAMRQYLEGGPNVATGCALCGWSILLEKPARRQEIAYFVAPRALATLFPRRYNREAMWREQLAYALSAAGILTAAAHSPRRVRGVFGRVLETVLQ